MNSPLENLNSFQLDAVQHTQGPLLILAGAGSGKTRTITYRIWYLIAKGGVSPWHILAVTFTNKAAAEMKNRVQALLPSSESRNVWISTFHSACVRILRQHINRLGLSRDFTILDANDQVKIVKKCIVDVDDHPLNHYAVLAEIRRAKNDLLSAGEYAELVEVDFFRSRVALVYQAYEERLRQDQALDFDDLLSFTYKLFHEHPDVLEYYQNRFRYIMVDEYQDTNHAQARLVNLLAETHQNICVVGDDDQSIYRWRGADIHNILDFEKLFPGTKVIRLEQNYRSTKTILEAANHVIANNDLRKAKKLWTANEKGARITLYEAMDEQSESRYISRQIQELKGLSNFPDYRDFAVLYRTNAQSRSIEEALRNDGIPYMIVGGLKFYERKEVKDLIAYLKVVSNPDNRMSLLRIINVPPRRIGQASLARIELFAAENHLSFFQSLSAILETPELKATQKHQLGQFLRSLQKWQDFRTDHTISQLMTLILEETDYFTYLQEEKTEQAEARVENVKELSAGIEYFENQHQDSSLEDFLDYVSLLSDIDEYTEESGAVTLMTAHSAKGLEFPAVFMAGMEENLFPLVRNAMDREELEEERRLCYVGMTRAKKRLFFTRAEHRTIYGNTQFREISRFIVEIPSDFFTESIIGSSNTITAEKSMISFVNPEKRRLTKEFPFPKDFHPSDEESNGDWQVGDRVYNTKWGEGTVFNREGEGENTKISVNFGGLKKKLLIKYAKLRKI